MSDDQVARRTPNTISATSAHVGQETRTEFSWPTWRIWPTRAPQSHTGHVPPMSARRRGPSFPGRHGVSGRHGRPMVCLPIAFHSSGQRSNNVAKKQRSPIELTHLRCDLGLRGRHRANDLHAACRGTGGRAPWRRVLGLSGPRRAPTAPRWPPRTGSRLRALDPPSEATTWMRKRSRTSANLP
jgi:hypothetical protein